MFTDNLLHCYTDYQIHKNQEKYPKKKWPYSERKTWRYMQKTKPKSTGRKDSSLTRSVDRIWHTLVQLCTLSIQHRTVMIIFPLVLRSHRSSEFLLLEEREDRQELENLYAVWICRLVIDFQLFGPLKQSLSGVRSDNKDTVQQHVLKLLRSVLTKIFLSYALCELLNAGNAALNCTETIEK